MKATILTISQCKKETSNYVSLCSTAFYIKPTEFPNSSFSYQFNFLFNAQQNCLCAVLFSIDGECNVCVKN